MDLKKIIEYRFINIGDFHLDLYNVIVVVLVIIIARLSIWSIRKVTSQYFKRKKVDVGRQYAFLQVVKYIIYTGAVLLVLEAVNISISILPPFTRSRR